MKKVTEIFETKNYNLFKFKDNRDIKQHLVDRAKRRLIATRKKCVIPVAVTPDMIVREGQHRVKACQELNIPVRFFKTKEIRLKDISTIQGGDKWSLYNYMKYHADQGVQNFIYLKEKYDKDFKELIGVGSFGVLFQDRAFTSRQLSNENFVLTHEMRRNFNVRSNELKEILNLRPDLTDTFKTEKWIKAFCLFMAAGGNTDHLKSRILATTKTLITSRQQQPVNDELCALYNFGLDPEDRIEL